MCGITGILQFDTAVDRTEIERFTAALHHRGPDGTAVHIDGGLALGHTRLAILDLTEAGRCPMPYGGSDGKRYWITFNGEVYNFLELRKELEPLGHRFRSDTDTEVIVAAYAQWGEECLFKFNGMWAFAIWDSLERKLFLARDRFGIKPLYFMTNTRLTFASELKAFLSLKHFTPQVHEALIPTIIANDVGYEGNSDQTPLKGIQKLPGGYSLVINSRGEISAKKWWETASHIPQVPTTYAEQVEQFREIFADAVKIRMRADVPVATCLSGGIDSSSVAVMMAEVQKRGSDALQRVQRNWQNAFVASFPGTILDERTYADEVAQKIGITPHYWIFSNDEALRHIVDSVWTMDDISSALAVPVWSLYRELRRKKVLVSLDGHGGDELLGGYAWFLDWPIEQFNQNLYRDFHYGVLPSILRNYDRLSMAHGVEVRMPIMDYRLVTFSFGLPAECKVGGGFTKRILRDSVEGILPERVRTRQQKIGFNSPLIEWLNGGLAPLLEQLTTQNIWRDNPYFDGKTIGSEALARCKAKAWTSADWDAASKLWMKMSFTLWHMLFIERSGGAVAEFGVQGSWR